MNDESVRLLPCPFCGCPAVLQTTAFPFFGWCREWAVACPLCDTSVGTRKWFTEKQIAIDRWNTRHPTNER